MKLVTIYERGGKLFVHSDAKTTDGVWILFGPILTPAEEAEDVGRAVRECLEASREGVAHPKQSEWGDLSKPLLQLAGVKSFNAFAKGTKCVQAVVANVDAITLIPFRNGGSSEGFVGIDEKSQTVTPGSDEELGAAVLGTLTMAE